MMEQFNTFTATPQARANWNAQLAERRLFETEQLALKNILMPAAVTTIVGGLDRANGDFDANVANLATSSGNTASVATLAATMETTLAANTQVLNEIAAAIPASVSTMKQILTSIEERVVSLNSALIAKDITAARTSTDQMKLAARTALSNTEDQVQQAAASNDSFATTNARTLQVRSAEEQLDSGKQNITQGNYVVALESLQAASVAARTAQLSASIGVQLGISTGTQASVSDGFSLVPATVKTSISDSNASISSTSNAATSSIHILKR